MRRGTIFRLTGLKEREELNGSHAIVVGDKDGKRWPSCVLGTSNPIVGVRVKEENCEVEDGVVERVKVQAWNDLGAAYAAEEMYSQSMEALHEALAIASSNLEDEYDEKQPGLRAESTRALANLAWLCLVMNRKGVELDGKRKTTDVLEWAMREIFGEVISLEVGEAGEDKVHLNFGAGRVPRDDSPPEVQLIMTARNSVDTPPRYYVLDEEKFVVLPVPTKENEGGT